MSRRILIFLLSLFLVLALDLLTKSAAFKMLPDAKDRFVCLEEGVAFKRVCNQGGIFGLFSGRLEILIPAMILAAAFFTWLFFEFRPRLYSSALACGFLLGGVLGNFYDRLFFEFVRDWIDFFIVWKGGTLQLPFGGKELQAGEAVSVLTFNLGDLFIFFGVLGLLFLVLLDRKSDKTF